MTHGHGHKANDVFAPRGAWQSGVSADFFALGYDAFGSLLPGRNYSSGSYRYLFQGQEHDDEINGAPGTSYAFEYRMHDSRIGRFLSIDPLFNQYPYYSPYAFSGNRLIDMEEFEGLEPRPARRGRGGRTVDPRTEEVWRGLRHERADRALRNDPHARPITFEQFAAWREQRDRFDREHGPMVRKITWNQLYPPIPVRHSRGVDRIEQANSREALDARESVKNGVTLYRVGGPNSRQNQDAQFWSTRDPRVDPTGFLRETGAYVRLEEITFIETATLRPGADFVTRPAAPNPSVFGPTGGAIEVVTQWGGTQGNQTIPFTPAQPAPQTTTGN